MYAGRSSSPLGSRAHHRSAPPPQDAMAITGLAGASSAARHSTSWPAQPANALTCAYTLCVCRKHRCTCPAPHHPHHMSWPSQCMPPSTVRRGTRLKPSVPLTASTLVLELCHRLPGISASPPAHFAMQVLDRQGRGQYHTWGTDQGPSEVAHSACSSMASSAAVPAPSEWPVSVTR